MKRRFDWDPKKDKRNQKKHPIPFLEAVSIFSDPYILSKLDEEDSITEDRWISLGISELERLLIVVHTERDADSDTEVIRLISARRAEGFESKDYYARRPS